MTLGNFMILFMLNMGLTIDVICRTVWLILRSRLPCPFLLRGWFRGTVVASFVFGGVPQLELLSRLRRIKSFPRRGRFRLVSGTGVTRFRIRVTLMLLLARII